MSRHIILSRVKFILAVATLSLLVLPGTAKALSANTLLNMAPVQTIGAMSTQEVVSLCTKSKFFGLVPWYQYMGREMVILQNGTEVDHVNEGDSYTCEVKCFNIFQQSKENECNQEDSDIPLVLLAIIDNLLRITGIAAVGFIIYGAFRYTASQGNPEQTGRAQNTIINALIGLAIAIMSIAFVSYLGHTLGGS